MAVREIALAFSAPESSADGQLPSEWLIFKSGVNPTLKGDVLFDKKSAKSVIDTYDKRGVDAWMDYEHERLNPPPGGAKASAWLNLSIRDGALWATNVRFTPPAVKALSNKEFRYFSPLVRVDEDNRVVELINLALTNDPATLNQPALVAASARDTESKQESRMKTVLVALGLAADADEAVALSAINRVKEQHRELLALSGKGSHAEALGEIAAWKASHGEVVALRAKLTDIEKKSAESEFDSVLEQAANKIPPKGELRDFALSLKGKPDGITMLRAFTAGLQTIAGDVGKKVIEEEPKGGDGKVIAFSRGELEMAKVLGGGRPDAVLERVAKFRAEGKTVRYGGFTETEDDKAEARRVSVKGKE